MLTKLHIIVVLSGTLSQYNLPLEAVLMIMGVDAIMGKLRKLNAR
jgi:Na+/H+-dicarboxylate symporter